MAICGETADILGETRHPAHVTPSGLPSGSQAGECDTSQCKTLMKCNQKMFETKSGTRAKTAAWAILAAKGSREHYYLFQII